MIKMQRSAMLAATIVVAGLSMPLTAAELATVPTQPPSVDQVDWVPDEIIVGFEQLPEPAQFDALAASIGVVDSFRKIPHAPHPKNDPDGVHPLALVRVIELQPGSDVPTAVQEALAVPGVRYAHPNHLTYLAFEPNDPDYWTDQYGPQIIDAPTAWDITMGSSDIIIAVADTGINYSHEDFQDGALYANPGEIPGNGIDDDGNGYIDDVTGWDTINDDASNTDGHGHGSHVAGIAAARMNNNKGMAGMAQASIIPLQVFQPSGGGSYEAITEAIYYAVDNGAHLLNYSGGGFGNNAALGDAVQYAWDNGMPVIAAMGNFNSSAPFYPAAYPAAIAISGTDRFDARYASSNWGDYIDVAAPGVDVYSAWRGGPTDYNSITGTSMSTPHVAGVVALMYTVNEDLTPQQVRDILRANTVDLGDPGFDVFFGHGRIDAGEAVAAVPSPCTADLNGDGVRDLADLGILLASYGVDDGGDLDGDGDTDLADLGELLAVYNTPCP